MQNSRCVSLVNVLNDKDAKDLSKEVALSPIEKKLFSILRNGHLKKEDVFLKLYDKEYSKEDDYIIRNDLRKLKKKLELYIVKKQLDQELKKNYYLEKELFCNYLLKNNRLKLLEKELRSVFNRIIKKEDYQVFYTFIELWYKLQNKIFVYDKSYFKSVSSFLDEYIVYWKLEVASKSKSIDIYRAFIKRTHQQTDSQVEFDESLSNIPLKAEYYNSNYLNYLELKEQSYKTHSDEKIKILKEAKKQLELVQNSKLNLSIENFSISQNIGVEYLIKNDVKNAALYLKEVLNLKEKLSNDYFVKGLFNYLSTKVRLGDYNEVIQLYKTYFQDIIISPLKDNFSPIICMCAILADNLKETKTVKGIVSSTTSFPNHIYSRLNLSILYYLDNEIDLCINELNNINQSIHYHKLSHNFKADLFFCKKFKSFIESTGTYYTKEEKDLKLKALQKEIYEFKRNEADEMIVTNNTLHLFWLNKTVQEKLSQL